MLLGFEGEDLEACVREQASAAFGDESLADQWLRRPNGGLGGRLPLEVGRTKAGVDRVLDALGRIATGEIF